VTPRAESAAGPAPEPPDQILAREERQHVPAAIGSFVAGVFTLVGGIVAAGIYRDFPRVPLVDALRDAAGRPLPGREGLRTEQILFYDEKAGELLLVAVILAIGALALLLPLTYLLRATKARRPQVPNAAIIVAVAGPVGLAVSELVIQIDVMLQAQDFADSADKSSEAARDALKGGLLVAGQILRQAAVLCLGFAFVLISLNAMRAGLLTRFMGILGIIVGVLFVVPLGGQLPIVQAFWLIALAPLFLRRWPNGVPPAWSTGKAEPWPTQQELREARERARAEASGGQAPSGERHLRRKQLPEPDPVLEEAPEEPEGKAHPSSKKKRRRRR
jgi:hypothetical protein